MTPRQASNRRTQRREGLAALVVERIFPPRATLLGWCGLFPLIALIATGCGAPNGASPVPGGVSAPSSPAPALLPHGEEPLVRVLLVETGKSLTLIPEAPWALKADGDPAKRGERWEASGDGEGEIEVRVGYDGSVNAHTLSGPMKGAVLVFEPIAPDGLFWIRLDEDGAPWERRPYEGRLEIRQGGNEAIEAVLTLPMEEYLRGVVPSEIGPTSPHEAMAAQAVAARSESFVALETGKYAGPTYDLCSHVMCQVFRGAERRTPQSDAAIRATQGYILQYEGKALSAYYASNCGGHMEDIRHVWGDRTRERAYWGTGRFDGEGNDAPALDLRQDDDLRIWLDSSPRTHCNHAFFDGIPDWARRTFRWTRTLTAEEVTAAVARRKDIGRVTAIRPVRRGVSGRLIELEFIGENGTLAVGPELTIRRLFTPQMRSAAFAIDAEGPAERPERFVFRGAGSGHGVGMCQTGAIGMAGAGRTFAEILAHYYPSANLKRMY